jgi:hypothetical protein
MKMRWLLGLFTLAVLALVIACGGDGDADEDGPTPTSDALGQPSGETSGLGEPGLDSPTVSLGSATAAVGETGEVLLSVLNFEAPGLGAWTVDVLYDANLLTLSDCVAGQESSVCNPGFASDMLRIVGATAVGLEGDTEIGRLTFQCDAVGESALALSVTTLADGTLGDPQLVAAHVEDGSITCNESSPTP